MTATLLDFDGVLVDSEMAHLAAFNDVLAPLGMAISRAEYFDHYLSFDDAAVFRSVLGRCGTAAPPDEQVKALVAAKGPRFLERFMTDFRVFPGAVDLVVRRAGRGPVGIVSGALKEEIVKALDRMSISSEVSFIVSAECCAASKPDPAPYLAAVQELGRLACADRVVAVEDSMGGVQAAKAAGIPCAGVAHCLSAAELAQAGADVAVADLVALTDELLDGLAAAGSPMSEERSSSAQAGSRGRPAPSD